jgi:hypothetical protein
MSVLFNIADKIIFGNTVPDYATFRKRVLADGGTITDDAQLREDMEWVWRYKPSWFASPAVRKTDVLYGAPDLDGTVTRATPKTGINSDGTIGSRVAGELPWSYKDDRISFLPESARTNLLQRSEEFDDAVWVKYGGDVTANETNAPDGTLTADLFTPTATNEAHRLDYENAGIPAGTGTVSFHFKPNGYSVVQITTLSATFVNYDLSTLQTFASTGTVSGTITPLADGWFRVTFTASYSGVTDRARFAIVPNLNSTRFESFLADGTSGIFIWGAQLEAGSFASTYIPTTTTALTRNADVLTVTGAQDVIGQTEGSMIAVVNTRLLGDAFSGASRRIFLASDGTVANRMGLIKRSDDSLGFFGVATTTQWDIASAINQSGVFALVGRYKANDFTFHANGNMVGTADTSGVVPNTSVLGLGIGINPAPFNESILMCALLPTAITTEQADAISLELLNLYS